MGCVREWLAEGRKDRVDESHEYPYTESESGLSDVLPT
jgi:hypothetical protein